MARILLSCKKEIHLLEFFPDIEDIEAVWPDGTRSGLLNLNYSLAQLKRLGWEIVRQKQMVNK